MPFQNKQTGQLVEVLQRYEGITTIREGDKVYTVPSGNIVEILDEPVAPINLAEVIQFPTPQLEANSEPAIEPEQKDVPIHPELEKLKINEVIDHLLIAKALPGLGRVASRSILKNRPGQGYENFEQLKDLNGNINLDYEGWQQIEQLLEF